MFVPIFVPRKYIPVSPKVSFVSLRTYMIVMFAAGGSRAEPRADIVLALLHLHQSCHIDCVEASPLHIRMLPPLADYDHLRNLAGQSLPVSFMCYQSRTPLKRRLYSVLTPPIISHAAIRVSSSSECFVSITTWLVIPIMWLTGLQRGEVPSFVYDVHNSSKPLTPQTTSNQKAHAP